MPTLFKTTDHITNSQIWLRAILLSSGKLSASILVPLQYFPYSYITPIFSSFSCGYAHYFHYQPRTVTSYWSGAKCFAFIWKTNQICTLGYDYAHYNCRYKPNCHILDIVLLHFFFYLKHQPVRTPNCGYAHYHQEHKPDCRLLSGLRSMFSLQLNHRPKPHSWMWLRALIAIQNTSQPLEGRSIAEYPVSIQIRFRSEPRF